ncbi:ufm1-specific protease 2-like [Ornithodoros turicata]|uniref:ufm1-specific protease 2-like n=1 Tax=Ornithodoros turicata TaxID=34597 RepID=UPI003138B333
MSNSYDVIISQALCEKLLQYQKVAKEPTTGFVYGWFAKNTAHCIGCALENPNVLLSFGYDIVGVFCVSRGETEDQISGLCHGLIIKYLEEYQHKGPENPVLLYTTPRNETTVFAKLATLGLEAFVEPEKVSVLENIRLGTCSVRARARVQLAFEMDADVVYLKKNLEVAADRLKKKFLPEVVAFQLVGSNVLLRRESIEKAIQDLVDQSGDSGRKRRNKGDAMTQEVLNFTILSQTTGEAAVEGCGTMCTPVVHYQKKVFKSMSALLCLDIVATVNMNDALSKVVTLLSEELCNQIDQMTNCISKFSKADSICIPEAFHFWPVECGHWVTVFYPAEVSEADLASYRKELHRLLLLPCNRPLFRRANHFAFPEELAADPYLRNTHLGLNPPSGCQVQLLRGQYQYRHYMQDRIDDKGWGCAYRSLQTIVSWFRIQGYTGQPVPSHREIQQALVNIGDKPSSFVGSKQWIGSMEVGYCLNNLLGVESKTLCVNAGAEMSSRARELMAHFDTQGTPIMIGGGVLAHTIIGIAFNEKTGDAHYLILDPHYTGGEDLSVIQNKGWCGWKNNSFWDQKSFYNVCLPQVPSAV